jgi:cytochrome c biogenesis protein ResB
MLKRTLSFIGSLQMAVVLLVAIGATLAYGTWFEATHNTAAVQRYVYQAWWFQALLGFLILNLAASAVLRLPWKQRHIGFVCTHVGIILMLIGGLVSIYRGVEGQIIIPQGQSSSTLQQFSSVLAVHILNPGEQAVFPVNFAATARAGGF